MSEVSQRLAKYHGGYWGDHPEYPWSDWVGEVEGNSTRLGYWEWAEKQIEFKEEANDG